MSHSTQSATHNYAGIAALGVATVDGAEIRSYAQCKAFWEAHWSGWKDRKVGAVKVASNVELQRHPDDSYTVRFYGTDIVHYWPDETFMATLGRELPNGKQVGSTPTTIHRLNQFAPSHYHRYKWRLQGYGAEERVPVVRP